MIQSLERRWPAAVRARSSGEIVSSPPSPWSHTSVSHLRSESDPVPNLLQTRTASLKRFHHLITCDYYTLCWFIGEKSHLMKNLRSFKHRQSVVNFWEKSEGKKGTAFTYSDLLGMTYLCVLYSSRRLVIYVPALSGSTCVFATATFTSPS